MLTIVQKTQVQGMHHTFFCLKTQTSEAYQKVLQISSYRKYKDIARHEKITKLSLVLEQGGKLLIGTCLKGEELEKCDHSGKRKFIL